MNLESTVVVTVDLNKADPDLSHVAEVLGVPLRDVDPAFGLLPVEIGGTVYAVKVSTKSLTLPRKGVEGPFSDPPIELFHP